MQRFCFALLILVLAACSGGTNPNPAPARNPTRGPLPTLEAGAFLPIGEIINVQNAPAIAKLATLVGHYATVNRIDIAPNSTYLLSIDAVARAHVWDLANMSSRHTFNGKPLLYAFFSADSATIIAVTEAGQIEFFDSFSGGLRATLPANKGGVFAAALSPDRKLLATGGVQGDVLLWDVDGRAQARTYPGASSGNVRAVTFSADSTLVAAIVNDTDQVGGLGVHLWKTSGEIITTLRGFGEQEPRQVAFSPDGKLLALGLRGEVRMYDLGTFAPRYTITQEDLRADRQVTFSPDSTQVLALGTGENNYVFKTLNGDRIGTLRGHDTGATFAGYSPDGALLLTTCARPEIGAFLWQPAMFTNDSLEHRRGVVGSGHNGILVGAWAPNGRFIALAEASGGIMLWGIPPG
jgi:WD40 repeat protein